jgi:hypothetical protein
MARRPHPPPEPPVLTVEQKRRRIGRLQTCIQNLQAFEPQKVQKRYQVPEVMALEAAIDEALSAAFGDNTPGYNRYGGAASLDPGPHVLRMGGEWGGPSNYDAVEAQEARQYFAEGKEQAIAMLQQAIRTIEDEIADQTQEASEAAPAPAYREGAFGEQPRPFVGWLMLLEDAPASRAAVSDKSPHFPVFPEFRKASYSERYNILCKKLVQERLYTTASIILSERAGVDTGKYSELSDLTGLKTFVTSFAGHVAAEAARG